MHDGPKRANRLEQGACLAFFSAGREQACTAHLALSSLSLCVSFFSLMQSVYHYHACKICFLTSVLIFSNVSLDRVNLSVSL